MKKMTMKNKLKLYWTTVQPDSSNFILKSKWKKKKNTNRKRKIIFYSVFVWNLLLSGFWNQNSDFFSILNCQQQAIALGIASEHGYNLILAGTEPLPTEWWKSWYSKVILWVVQASFGYLYAKWNGTSRFLFPFSCTLPCKRSREQNEVPGSHSRKLGIKPFWVSVCSCSLRALIQAEPRKMGHIIRYELPKRCCYSVGTEAQIWATIFTPENRSQRVRQIAELWESLGPSLLLTMRVFWVRCYLWSWKHLPGTTPGLQPSPFPLDSQQWLCTSFLQNLLAQAQVGLSRGHRKPPALSPTGYASIREVSQGTSTSAFAATGLASAPSTDSQSRGPTNFLGPGTYLVPPALQGPLGH